jgi:predicted permease
MSYFERLFNLMVEVMLPLSLLVAAGGAWPIVFKDVPVEHTRTQLNRLVMYLFYPSIMFAVAATTPITGNLLSVPLLVGAASLCSGGLLYWLLYWSPLGRNLKDTTRAVLVVGGMFGNTFNIGAPVLVFFFGADAMRYAIFNDMLMQIPLVWTLGVWVCTRLGSHRDDADQPSVLRVMLAMPPIWAFIGGVTVQQLGLVYAPLISATHFIGQATIPVILFVLGMTIPWRELRPRPEILASAGVKLLIAPSLAWATARLLFHPMGEAQYAAVVEGTTPAMVMTLLLADRFRLDHGAAALLIGWSTILFWITLPLALAARLIR